MLGGTGYKRREVAWQKVISDADWQTAVQGYTVAKNNLASANKIMKHQSL